MAKQPISQDALRRRQIAAAWDAYYGKFPPSLRKVRGADDNMMVNRCRGIVDVGVDFLFGKDISLQLPSKATKRAQAFLDGTWQQNRMMSRLQDAALNGGVAGHTFIRTVQDARLQYPRLVVMDPSTVTIVADADDADRISGYIVDWDSVDMASGDAIQRRQLLAQEPSGSSWLITDLRRNGTQATVGSVGSSSSLAVWQQMGTAVWPYAWSPIHHCKNLPAPNQQYGLADLGTDIIQINKDVNFLISNMARIVRFHAHPKLWGKNFNADQVKVGVDDMIILPGDNGEINMLEMHGDLASSQTLVDRLLASMDALSRVPSIALGILEDIPKGTISGVALAVLYAPILQKTDTKRRLYGDMVEELFAHVLEMGGFASQGQIAIHWPQLLPVDPIQAANVAQLQLEAGFSHDTVIQQMGGDPEEEAQKRAAELADPTLSPPTPATVADAAPADQSGDQSALAA